ncbi:Protein phosphatase 1 regulatory subunit 27 [Amphibalanus amphitrite]|uniref:Protein phosphatase 1 regulatory subunit 27 n=1 Tax=Amphibalanus amphitrite TaxID=1232801 RepID=A0A6A4WUA7_AMPAM|nr:Protein phosphatase 1 regulatory subunit 27 [Amphibalanus amphitrite]
MWYAWLKTLVGLLLTVNYSLPLFTILSDRRLWEEPVAVLAGNMSFVCLFMGVNLSLTGAYDLLQLDMVALCRTLQYTGIGFGVASKTAQLCMAVDQFVAISRPLQHLSLMAGARCWLVAATWATWALQFALSSLTGALDLVTVADSAHGRGNGTAVYPGCRWETHYSVVFAMIVEVELVSFSLATIGLFSYTFWVGYRTSRRLSRRVHELQNDVAQLQESRNFLRNYRVFKRVVLVFLLTVAMDILSPENGLTALHQAALDGNLPVVRILTRFGADLNCRDTDSWTPLHAACSMGHHHVARYLLESGADPTLLTEDGERPLDLVDPSDLATVAVMLQPPLVGHSAEEEEEEDEDEDENSDHSDDHVDNG